LTALLLAVKPFIGFGLSGHIKSSVQTNIFAKVFTKRIKVNNTSDFNSVQQQLAKPVTDFALRFSFLLAILFPLAFITGNLITARYLHTLQLNLSPRQLSLLTGQLLI
jgi:hypothetical protein